MDVEQLRAQYQPQRVRTLFVGESAPAGGSFFYAGDSALFRYTREAFVGEMLDSETDHFLADFKRRGFWLIDLCATPVNGMTRSERRLARKQGVETLADQIRQLRPEAIVIVMKGILPQVVEAIRHAGRSDIVPAALPFPAFGHQRKYVEGLRDLLSSLLAE